VKPLALPNCATIGFHGTPQRGSVGRAVSHGCVRLYDEDVRRLFEQVEVGTPVTVLP
jgi:lipoprotein-anchoring transpeptidase ErfK/SrfK